MRAHSSRRSGDGEIVVCDKDAEFYCSELGNAYAQLRFRPLVPPVAEEQDFGRCEALVSFGNSLPDRLFQRAPRLRWVQMLGAGTDRIMSLPGLPPSLWVSSASGIHGPMLAEMVVYLMLALARRGKTLFQNQAQGVWKREEGMLLCGKNVLVAGTGASGMHIRRLCEALGMCVVAASGAPRPVEHAEACIAMQEIDGHLADVDFLVLATPYSDRTRGLIGPASFSAMKRSAYLVNVSRGGIVDEGALVEALDRERIAGAALDVFQQEPLPREHALWRHPRVLATPHVAGLVREYPMLVLPLLKHNVGCFARGDASGLRNLVKLGEPC
ncbi:Glycerate dehydrogenase [Pigmentiphaga humi]|uniref:Glycerate dehydrogenase n=1 Tax=Pigmentiphaga humi TaxID=2478468 RepID=A0A3P4B6Z0_9BURK|nr:D-2-hydroxyacid dehydrogenase [Pigmentiphaga humi]VCU71842.1 Glycerate dehydrogenase [Pigmentiphaga humi]